MRLYDDPIAPTPRRVRMFLAEKGMDIPKVPIIIGKGEHKTETYRKLAPNTRVPALELDDGTVILESVAICRYIEGIQPEPPLMGTTPKEQALIEMWQRRIEFELLLPMASVFRHSHPKMAALEHQVPEFAAAQKPIAEQRLALLDEDLARHEFIAGDRFSIADITAFTTVEFFCKYGGIPLPEGLDNVRRWRDQVAARPSAQA
ncbi:glutathione S-transferase family protein [Indioceanicola profundi]|uniref:glutathione S-transferase family protein n=1 Tax=Indioceanicola profundi TaxID=2220096 RepID=UPI000E6AB4F7|nr:glutathione S-transferase [Indioceanicola profundi]